MYACRSYALIGAVACAASLMVIVAGAQAPAPSPGGEAPGAGRLIATGRGRTPSSPMSKPRARLMARRAAMLEAYKDVLKNLGECDSRIERGTGHERVQGVVAGARLLETRYYDNGDVEVDIEVPAPPGRRWAMFAGPPAEEKERETGLVSVEKGGGRISESEWREVLVQSPASRP